MQEKFWQGVVFYKKMNTKGKLCRKEYVTIAAKKNQYAEEKCARMDILFVQSAFTVGFLGRHASHVPCVENP